MSGEEEGSGIDIFSKCFCSWEERGEREAACKPELPLYKLRLRTCGKVCGFVCSMLSGLLTAFKLGALT